MSIQRTVGDYLVLKKLGSGSTATVWSGSHRDTHLQVAIKVINREKLAPALLKRVDLEISIMKKLQHPHLLRLYETIHTDKHIYLILEYCEGGDLSRFIKSKGKLSANTSMYLFQQLASGLRYLYSANLIHRDIKPQNLLLTMKQDRVILKIADFGFARRLDDLDLAATLCCSPLYGSPELLGGQSYDGRVDLWSAGMVLHEMVTGKLPLMVSGLLDLIKTLKKPLTIAMGIPHRDLICALLRRKAVDRLSFHDFFTTLCPSYAEIRTVIRNATVLSDVAGKYFKNDAIARLGLHLKAGRLIHQMIGKLRSEASGECEWVDVIVYLEEARDYNLGESTKLRERLMSRKDVRTMKVVCIEKVIYDLALALALRGSQREMEVVSLEMASADYLTSLKLLEVLSLGNGIESGNDRVKLKKLMVKIQERQGLCNVPLIRSMVLGAEIVKDVKC